MAAKKQLGQILLEAGAIDEFQLKSALGYQKQWGGRLGKVLVENRFITEKALVEAIHQQTGIRLVFDQLHHLYHPTTDMTSAEALHLALSTWPEDQTPKIHFSSPRTSMNTVETRDNAGTKRKRLREPRTTQHADLIDPFAFIQLLDSVREERDFDVMLECKAKDLALLRLRKHLDRLAPAAVASHRIT